MTIPRIFRISVVLNFLILTSLLLLVSRASVVTSSSDLEQGSTEVNVTSSSSREQGEEGSVLGSIDLEGFVDLEAILKLSKLKQL